MRIERFEDAETWRLARELTHKVYDQTKKTRFARDCGLKGQIQDAAGLWVRCGAYLTGVYRNGSSSVKVNKG